MHETLTVQIFDTAFWSLLLWNFLVRPAWPWDWKGKRKSIKLNTRPRNW